VSRLTADALWVLDAPTISVQAGNLKAGLTGTIRMPCPSYLVKRGESLILFDTGIAPEVAADPRGFRAKYPRLELDYPLTARLTDQLAILGYLPQDVTHVVTSHAHHDHCGGLFLFPKARHFIGAEEIRWAYWPDPPGEHNFDASCFEPLRGAQWHYIRKHQDHDLFGDRSVVVLSTPGHTPGSISMLVRLPGQAYILAGDAVHMREALAFPHAGVMDYNSRDVIDSIFRLRLLADSENARVLISHDPEDWHELPKAPTPVLGSLGA
jgi:glyoxylase-like metal-dependent hydrolase (beta-lactamase superfamily II)